MIVGVSGTVALGEAPADPHDPEQEQAGLEDGWIVVIVYLASEGKLLMF